MGGTLKEQTKEKKEAVQCEDGRTSTEQGRHCSLLQVLKSHQRKKDGPPQLTGGRERQLHPKHRPLWGTHKQWWVLAGTWEFPWKEQESKHADNSNTQYGLYFLGWKIEIPVLLWRLQILLQKINAHHFSGNGTHLLSEFTLNLLLSVISCSFKEKCSAMVLTA